VSQLSSRLVRLLNLVPYFQANPGISAAEAAVELGVTTKQLMADLNQLWMCGLPGYGPGDLIDLSFSEDSIEVTFSAGMDRPLRLTSPEATAVLVANPIELADTESPAAAAVRDAVRRHRALAIDYYSASRDATSHRIVDPIRVVFIGDYSYLEAWCRAAEDVRLFRFDRIDAATVLDERSAPPPPAVQAGPDTSLFDADPSLPAATLRVAPSASWMFDYYPMRALEESSDGSCTAVMTFASEEWMARLVLGFGSAVRVLSPNSLAERVQASASAALQAYDAGQGQERSDPGMNRALR
jgi:proteasome accessory factor C